MSEKQELRKRISALRRECLSDAEAKESCLDVWRQTEALEQFEKASAVLLYAALEDEIPTDWPLREWYLRKTLVLPVVQGDRLVLKRYDPNSLIPGYKGIMEPDGTCEEVNPADIDFAIIPGVAFDHRGMRLGRGKGFYDRLLPLLDCPVAGVALKCQVVEHIPADPWDKPVSVLIVSRNV